MKANLKKTTRVLALALCCGLLFTACRPSTALTRTRYDPDDLNVVNDANYIGSEEQLEEQTEIEYLAGQEVDEDSSNTEQDLTAGQVKEDESLEDTADLTPELIYNSLREDWMDLYGAAQVSTDSTNEADSSTLSDSQAGDKTAASSSAAGGSSGGSASSSGSEDEDENDETVSLNEEEETGSVEGNDVTVDPTGEEAEEDEEKNGGDEDEEQNNKITDENGDPVTLVSGEGKVAAVGEAATLVCMLAGADRLCATSESQVSDDNPLLQRAFPLDEEKCEILWSGDGSSALSDEDFEILLAIGPDMCFYLSGSGTFSSEQIDRLYEMYEEQGADPEQHVICLDNFSTQEGIETAVYQMGIALGEEDRAMDYREWCEDLEEELSDLSSIYTIFIYDWDDTAVTTTYGWIASGEIHTDDDITMQIQDGAAVIRVGTNWDRAFLEYAESYANIEDRSKRPYNYQKGSTEYDQRFSLWFGHWVGNDYLSTSLADMVSYCTPDGDLCEISAVYTSSVQTLSTLSGKYDPLTTVYKPSARTEWRSTTDGAFYLLVRLGETYFPGVIVRNQDVYDSLTSSTLWNLDTYDVGYYIDYDNQKKEYYYTYGSSTDGEDRIISVFRGDYGVYVNPTGGIGSWMDGSAESVLESVWAANVLQGYSKSGMYSAIRSFYSVFYGLTLTNAEIDQYVLATE